MKKSLAILVATAAVAAFSTAHAGEAEIRAALTKSFPGIQVNSVSKSAVKGLYEVVADSTQVIYADENGEHIVIGEMMRTTDKRNLTRERTDKLLEVKWDSLPLKDAIKVVRGKGSRKFAVFSDPDCPYCRKAEVEFAKLDDVTIYVFLYPLDMHPDAGRKSRLVWCSKDRSAAWLDLMLKGVQPSGKGECANPLDENLALGRKLRIDGTPAVIFTNGKRVPGYVDAGRLEAMLAAVNK